MGTNNQIWIHPLNLSSRCRIHTRRLCPAFHLRRNYESIKKIEQYQMICEKIDFWRRGKKMAQNKQKGISILGDRKQVLFHLKCDKKLQIVGHGGFTWIERETKLRQAIAGWQQKYCACLFSFSGCNSLIKVKSNAAEGETNMSPLCFFNEMITVVSTRLFLLISNNRFAYRTKHNQNID